jgi:hypothetical protein
MASKLNWNFRVNWLGEDHILIAYKKQNNDEWQEFPLTIQEYTEWMHLLNDFNANFYEQLTAKLVNSYLDE